MTAHSVASAHTYYSMFEGRPQSNPHERDRLLLGVLVAGGFVEEADFLEDEAVVTAGGGISCMTSLRQSRATLPL